jgi:deoxyhypusine synthase
MYWAVAGAMSSAQLGITLAPAIRAGLVHGLSVTGANLEESLFRLVAHHSYKDFPDYRYFTKQDDTRSSSSACAASPTRRSPRTRRSARSRRSWCRCGSRRPRTASAASGTSTSTSWCKKLPKKLFEGNPDECWLLAAAEKNLPIVVPGHEDSTFGNIFASHVKTGECSASIVKSGIEYMAQLYDDYRVLSKGKGVGFFQIGGGIAGDFPICVVPSIKYDLQEPVKPWAYFCQISDSTTSYGSYSGATPNEKITWDKLTEDTPMFVIESDATIVVPLMLQALLECKADPKGADAIVKASRSLAKAK